MTAKERAEACAKSIIGMFANTYPSGDVEGHDTILGKEDALVAEVIERIEEHFGIKVCKKCSGLELSWEGLMDTPLCVCGSAGEVCCNVADIASGEPT